MCYDCWFNDSFSTLEFDLVSCEQKFIEGAPLITITYEVVSDYQGALADQFVIYKRDDP